MISIRQGKRVQPGGGLLALRQACGHRIILVPQTVPFFDFTGTFLDQVQLVMTGIRHHSCHCSVDAAM